MKVWKDRFVEWAADTGVSMVRHAALAYLAVWQTMNHGWDGMVDIENLQVGAAAAGLRLGLALTVFPGRTDDTN